MATATTTILLFTQDRIARADFAGGSRPRLLNLWQQVSTAHDTASAVETALFAGGRAGRRVFVLSTDVWMQLARLPARSVAGLATSQVSQALAFEAEPVSGIAAIESAVGYHDLGMDGAERRYWVSQIAAHELTMIEDMVAHAGGKLEAVAHPGGIAAANDTSRDRARVEVWPGVIMGVAPDDVDIVSLDARSTDWRAALGDWLSARGNGAIDRLTADGALTAAQSAGASASDEWSSLADETTLTNWLCAAAEAITQKQSAVPLIRPIARPMSETSLQKMMLLIFALTLIACAGHYRWLDMTHNDVLKQLDDDQKQTQRDTTTQRRIADAQKQVDALTMQVTALRDQQTQRVKTRDLHRKRWTRLLTLMAEHRPQDLVVQKIDAKHGTVTISGVCLDPQIANDWAAQFSGELASLGWRVQPPEKDALQLTGDGGPWAFSIALTDAPVAKPAPLPSVRPSPVVRKTPAVPTGGP